MSITHASRHHGLPELPAVRNRAKRLLKSLKNGEADDTRLQLRPLGLPDPRLPSCRHPMADGAGGRIL
jgi:hypothetical protein